MQQNIDVNYLFLTEWKPKTMCSHSTLQPKKSLTIFMYVVHSHYQNQGGFNVCTYCTYKITIFVNLTHKNTYSKVISLNNLWFISEFPMSCSETKVKQWNIFFSYNISQSLFVICCVLISWLVIDLFSLYIDYRNILLSNYHMNGCLITWYTVKIFFASLENCVSNWCSHSQLFLLINISAMRITKYNNVPNNLSKTDWINWTGQRKKVVKILMCGYVHVVHVLDWLSIKQIITFWLKLCSSRRSVSDKLKKGTQVWEGF